MTSGEVPRARDSGPYRGGGRSLLIPVLAALAVLVAAGVGFIALRGDDGDPSGGAETGGTREGVSPTTTAAPATTAPPAHTGPFVELRSAELEGDQLRVDYQVSNYTPLDDGRAGSQHVHVFLDTTERDNAGVNGDPAGRWYVTDEPSSVVTDFTPDELADASQVCVLVADHVHNVFERGGEPTGNCIALPT